MKSFIKKSLLFVFICNTILLQFFVPSRFIKLKIMIVFVYLSCEIFIFLIPEYKSGVEPSYVLQLLQKLLAIILTRKALLVQLELSIRTWRTL